MEPDVESLGPLLCVVHCCVRRDPVNAFYRADATNGQIDAIKKSQSVIEFEMDGTTRWANQKFLDAMAYAWSEIKGRHHGMFVEPADRNSSEHAEFWKKFNRGEYQVAEDKRLGKEAERFGFKLPTIPLPISTGTPSRYLSTRATRPLRQKRG